MKRILVMLGMLSLTAMPLSAADIGDHIEAIRNVGLKGSGNVAASKAWRQLLKSDTSALTEILGGMKGAGPIATNYLRAAVDAIAEREIKRGGKLPIKALEAFVADTANAPRGRRTAYELIRRVDETAETRIIPDLFNDPSLELRRDAIALLLGKASQAKGEDASLRLYRKALTNARDLDQIDAAAKALEKAGHKVDLPRHFGFIQSWNLIAPFDNVEKRGFDVSYPPEKRVDLTAKYNGKDGSVKWSEHKTSDKYGNVDLNKALGKHKGAIAYAYAEFYSKSARDAELRLGCINANKVWLNGKLLTANNVYHANTKIDQYVGKGKLSKGRNVILVKIAQNEQTEDWAQRWQFQLRVCDQYGTAILSGK